MIQCNNCGKNNPLTKNHETILQSKASVLIKCPCGCDIRVKGIRNLIVKQSYPLNMASNITNDSLPNLENFGYWVKNKRSKKNISQGELSKRTGITQGRISQIEKGKTLPKLGTIKRITTALYEYIQAGG